MRYAVLVGVALVAVPLALAGVVVAATALLGEFFGFQLVDFSEFKFLDWFFAIGAGARSWENYLMGFVGVAMALAGGAITKFVWDWARADQTRPVEPS